jgi:hypothetical protein
MVDLSLWGLPSHFQAFYHLYWSRHFWKKPLSLLSYAAVSSVFDNLWRIEWAILSCISFTAFSAAIQFSYFKALIFSCITRVLPWGSIRIYAPRVLVDTHIQNLAIFRTPSLSLKLLKAFAWSGVFTLHRIYSIA